MIRKPTRCSHFITCGWRFAIPLLMLLGAAACRGQTTARVIPRDPRVNSWVAVRFYGLRASETSGQIMVQDAAGGPSMQMPLRPGMPVIIPMAFVAPVADNHWRLKYRILPVGKTRTPWKNITVRITHAKLNRTALRYFIVGTAAAVRRARRKGISGLHLTSRDMAIIPTPALGAMGRCVFVGAAAMDLRAAIVRRLISANVPIFALTRKKLPSMMGFIWQRCRLAHAAAQRLVYPAVIGRPHPILARLTHLRLPPIAAPRRWWLVAIIVGPATILIMSLVWVAAGRRRQKWGLMLLVFTSVAISGVAVGCLEKVPGIDRVNYQWNASRSGASIGASFHCTIYRALRAMHLKARGQALLPAAWSIKSWRHLNQSVHFSADGNGRRRIGCRLVKAGAAVFQSETLLLHMAGKAPARLATVVLNRGQLQSGGTTNLSISMNTWIGRQPPGLQPSIRAWLILQKNPRAKYRLWTAHYFWAVQVRK